LDLVGERWALLVVRELLLGPKRFTDLRAGIPDLSSNILSQRLRELEQVGVVLRRKLPPPAGSWIYELTAWGYELEPVILALGRWGRRSPLHPRDAELGTESLVLALKADFDPAAGDGLTAGYELRLGEDRFHVEVADGQIELGRGAAHQPDAAIETDPRTLAALLWQGRPLAEALQAKDIRIEGSRTAVTRFLSLFPPPEPVPTIAQP
ncbi:MAG TPA: winged helix-turn-helix transcriptional regulator, partial [Micromonosporaceae bacterium]|nr:winged helix-turn-helix transcriptional regulator [Micromonosporaceae bacterium]